MSVRVTARGAAVLDAALMVLAVSGIVAPLALLMCLWLGVW